MTVIPISLHTFDVMARIKYADHKLGQHEDIPDRRCPWCRDSTIPMEQFNAIGHTELVEQTSAPQKTQCDECGTWMLHSTRCPSCSDSMGEAA